MLQKCEIGKWHYALRPSNAQTLAQPNNPPLYLLPTAHRSTLDACAPSMARLAHASVIGRPSLRVKSIPDPIGRTLAPTHSLSLTRSLPLYSARRCRCRAPLDPAATGTPSPRSFVWEMRRPPLLLPRPLVEAGAIYIEGIRPFFVLGRGLFSGKLRRRRSSPSLLPFPTDSS